jgi:hypothetical protein
MRRLAEKHDKVYERAVKRLERDQLVAAADDLDAAAKIYDDALAGRAVAALREVRFDREMARRLRKVAELGGGGKELFDRVASFYTTHGEDHALVYAAARLAQAKLLRDYRNAKSREDAVLAARVFYKAVDVQSRGFPPVISEMRERYIEVRLDPYNAPPYAGEGDPLRE